MHCDSHFYYGLSIFRYSGASSISKYFGNYPANLQNFGYPSTWIISEKIATWILWKLPSYLSTQVILMNLMSIRVPEYRDNTIYILIALISTPPVEISRFATSRFREDVFADYPREHSRWLSPREIGQDPSLPQIASFLPFASIAVRHLPCSLSPRGRTATVNHNCTSLSPFDHLHLFFSSHASRREL